MEKKKVVQKVVLGAVVVNKEGKVLIVQRSADEEIYPNLWELPSGKKEPLETSEYSLLREVKEETGLDVKIIGLVSVFDYQVEKPEEIRDSTQINFLVKPINGEEVVLSDEHQNYAWIGRENIEIYDMTKSTKKVIAEAEKLYTKLF